MKLLWGDLHSHLVDFDRGDAILRDARENIDFTAVLCYPFDWDVKRGLRTESVGNRPHFLEGWGRLRALARAHHEPGRFVTFLGYEWNGNRTRYGDHNVIYFDDGPLDDAWTLEELYANLRGTRAMAIPHHTGYLPEHRGKDWRVFDPALSPVMEMFSIHGSSEGCNTPLGMLSNSSMGPRTSGGAFHDALARGLRVGVIGSNDYAGLPGRWGIGRAAVWADDCTREGIWSAILARRTYAVTGDRIRLAVHIDGQPMGSEVAASGPVDVEVAIEGSHAIDRIELLDGSQRIAGHSPVGRPRAGGRHKFLLEAGWGPSASYGLQAQDWTWDGQLHVDGGRLVGVERCFSLHGQHAAWDAEHCSFHLVTAGRDVRAPFGMTQGLVFEVEGTQDTHLRLGIEGRQIDVALGDLAAGARLAPFLDESTARVRETFGLDAADVNPDMYYHNARKVKLHRAVPESAWRVAHTFRDVRLDAGAHPLYVRVAQQNGQYAWSSPIWVSA